MGCGGLDKSEFGISHGGTRASHKKANIGRWRRETCVHRKKGGGREGANNMDDGDDVRDG